MTQEFKPLTNENHAIDLKNQGDNFFLNSPMFKLKDLISAIQRKFLEINHKDWEEEKQELVICHWSLVIGKTDLLLNHK